MTKKIGRRTPRDVDKDLTTERADVVRLDLLRGKGVQELRGEVAICAPMNMEGLRVTGLGVQSWVEDVLEDVLAEGGLRLRDVMGPEIERGLQRGVLSREARATGRVPGWPGLSIGTGLVENLIRDGVDQETERAVSVEMRALRKAMGATVDRSLYAIALGDLADLLDELVFDALDGDINEMLGDELSQAWGGVDLEQLNPRLAEWEEWSRWPSKDVGIRNQIMMAVGHVRDAVEENVWSAVVKST